jgi:hypothetical protein
MKWAPERNLDMMLGSVDQIAGARRVILDDGSERGVRAVDVRPAGGIHALVLSDRGLDIGPASHAGWPLHWQSTCEARHPTFFDGQNWLDNFHGGLMVTCGMQNVGPESEEDGKVFGLHGRVSNTPATDVSVQIEMSSGSPSAVVVSGRVRETAVYGDDLTLDRTLRFAVGQPEISLTDVVTNSGHHPAVMMLLYHFNIGYPIVSPNSRLEIPNSKVTGFEEAVGREEEFNRFTNPSDKLEDLVYEHRVERSSQQVARLFNPTHTPTGGIGIDIKYNPAQLGQLWQWRMLSKGMYLIGIEPANCGIRGRTIEHANGTVDVLEPGDTRTFDLLIEAFTGSVDPLDNKRC